MSTPQYQQQAQATDADPEQDKWLDDAVENVKRQAFFMKRALDAGDIREALKFAAAMTGELRTSNLSPKNYYELYMDVTNELRDLEAFFAEEEASNGRSIMELYENVQHAGNIIPRLYLLITVASVYIKSKRAPAKDILFDLVELCRGVQHPMRGLFLRNYLSQISKDKLPDSNSGYEGTVKDAIEFILQNFGEMNKLWVRMQHQGAVRERARREKERRNLRQLVGVNLVRLSEMEGVDLATYRDHVLPRILEQVVNCKDTIAQEYLMDIVIQVFPDEFHLNTLESFLATLTQLVKTVNVKNIIISLMNRLSQYAKTAQETSQPWPSQIEMFPLFLKYSKEAIEANSKISLEDILSLQVALINFASSVYPERLEYMDLVLQASVSALPKGKGPIEPACVTLVMKLLTLPLDSLQLRILELENYAALMALLDFENRKLVAVNVMEAVVKGEKPLDTVDKLEKLFTYLSPILKDQEDAKAAEKDSSADFEFDQEQHLAARLFHLVHHPDTDMQFALFVAARKHYGQGGTRRIQYSLPPLVFGCLELAARVFAREEKKDEDAPAVKSKKVFGFVHEIITVLAPHAPQIAMRLFLQAAQCSDTVAYEAISYEFVAQALVVYEEEISGSQQQFPAVNLISATLQSFRSMGEENYDTLITKTTQHAAKLLLKADACQAVYNCAHLFWPASDSSVAHRDEKRVLECLQRSLKIANLCVGSQVHLFVEILNKYLYFFDRGCPSITVTYLKGLIALIEEHLPNLDNSELSQQARRHYQNTLAHVQLKQDQQDALGERYRAISAVST